MRITLVVGWSLVVASFTASQLSFGAETFNRLKCGSIGGDNVKISVKDDKLTFIWKARKRATPHPLVRAAAAPEISDELLASYFTVETEVSFPVDSCTYQEPLGAFVCTPKNAVKYVSKASTISDRAPSKEYTGELTSLSLRSKFSEKNAMSFYNLILAAKVKDKVISMATSDYIAEDHTAEGRSFQPECAADGAPVYAPGKNPDEQ